jgi:hypothetical protein
MQSMPKLSGGGCAERAREIENVLRGVTRWATRWAKELGLSPEQVSATLDPHH